MDDVKEGEISHRDKGLTSLETLRWVLERKKGSQPSPPLTTPPKKPKKPKSQALNSKNLQHLLKRLNRVGFEDRFPVRIYDITDLAALHFPVTQKVI